MLLFLYTAEAEPPQVTDSASDKTGIIIGAAAGGFIIIVVAVIAGVVYRRRCELSE